MRKILLISSSTIHGTGYLDHCADEIESLLAEVKGIGFVPFALADHDGYTAQARKRFEAMGFALDSLHESADPRAAVEEAPPSWRPRPSRWVAATPSAS